MAVIKRKFKVNRFKVKDTAASSRRAAPGSKLKAKPQPEVGKYVKIRPPVHSEKSSSPRVNPTKSKSKKAKAVEMYKPPSEAEDDGESNQSDPIKPTEEMQVKKKKSYKWFDPNVKHYDIGSEGLECLDGCYYNIHMSPSRDGTTWKDYYDTTGRKYRSKAALFAAKTGIVKARWTKRDVEEAREELAKGRRPLVSQTFDVYWLGGAFQPRVSINRLKLDSEMVDKLPKEFQKRIDQDQSLIQLLNNMESNDSDESDEEQPIQSIQEMVADIVDEMLVDAVWEDPFEDEQGELSVKFNGRVY